MSVQTVTPRNVLRPIFNLNYASNITLPETKISKLADATACKTASEDLLFLEPWLEKY